MVRALFSLGEGTLGVTLGSCLLEKPSLSAGTVGCQCLELVPVICYTLAEPVPAGAGVTGAVAPISSGPPFSREAIPLVKGETCMRVLGTGVSHALWWVRPRSLGGEKGARVPGWAVLGEGRVCVHLVLKGLLPGCWFRLLAFKQSALKYCMWTVLLVLFLNVSRNTCALSVGTWPKGALR